jgi:hypothetical protein
MGVSTVVPRQVRQCLDITETRIRLRNGFCDGGFSGDHDVGCRSQTCGRFGRAYPEQGSELPA